MQKCFKTWIHRCCIPNRIIHISEWNCCWRVFTWFHMRIHLSSDSKCKQHKPHTLRNAYVSEYVLCKNVQIRKHLFMYIFNVFFFLCIAWRCASWCNKRNMCWVTKKTADIIFIPSKTTSHDIDKRFTTKKKKRKEKLILWEISGCDSDTAVRIWAHIVSFYL